MVYREFLLGRHRIYVEYYFESLCHLREALQEKTAESVYQAVMDMIIRKGTRNWLFETKRNIVVMPQPLL